MSAQPVNVLAVMLADALAAEDWRVLKTGDRNGASARKFSDEARAAVAELVRLTERVLYVQSLTGNAKAQAWDKLDRDLRDALARVQGGQS